MFYLMSGSDCSDEDCDGFGEMAYDAFYWKAMRRCVRKGGKWWLLFPFALLYECIVNLITLIMIIILVIFVIVVVIIATIILIPFTPIWLPVLIVALMYKKRVLCFK